MVTEKIRDNLYVQKGMFGGYSMVYPFRNDDKTWNKRNIVMFCIKFFGIILLGILLLVLWRQDVKVCQDMISDNFTACKICSMQTQQIWNNYNSPLGNLSFVGGLNSS